MDATVDKTPPAWLVDALDRSDADIAAGRVVPIEPVLSRIEASIARQESTHRDRDGRAHEGS